MIVYFLLTIALAKIEASFYCKSGLAELSETGIFVQCLTRQECSKYKQCSKEYMISCCCYVDNNCFSISRARRHSKKYDSELADVTMETIETLNKESSENARNLKKTTTPSSITSKEEENRKEIIRPKILLNSTSEEVTVSEVTSEEVTVSESVESNVSKEDRSSEKEIPNETIIEKSENISEEEYTQSKIERKILTNSSEEEYVMSSVEHVEDENINVTTEAIKLTSTKNMIAKPKKVAIDNTNQKEKSKNIETTKSKKKEGKTTEPPEYTIEDEKDSEEIDMQNIKKIYKSDENEYTSEHVKQNVKLNSQENDDSIYYDDDNKKEEFVTEVTFSKKTLMFNNSQSDEEDSEKDVTSHSDYASRDSVEEDTDLIDADEAFFKEPKVTSTPITLVPYISDQQNQTFLPEGIRFKFLPLVVAGFLFSGLVGFGVYMYNRRKEEALAELNTTDDRELSTMDPLLSISKSDKNVSESSPENMLQN